MAWNGRHDNGTIGNEADDYVVPEGLYTFNLFVWDLSDNYATTAGTVRVSLTPPTLSSVTAVPNPIAPNGDNINDQSTISFTVSNMAASQSMGSLTFTKVSGAAR